jgi:N-acetylglucosamine-6-phosphate deacetylase
VPARAAGIDRRIASLGAGKVANLVAFDDDMNAKLVLIEGDIRLDKRS